MAAAALWRSKPALPAWREAHESYWDVIRSQGKDRLEELDRCECARPLRSTGAS